MRATNFVGASTAVTVAEADSDADGSAEADASADCEIDGAGPAASSLSVPSHPCVSPTQPDDRIFIVAEPLFWTDCADNVVADYFYWDGTEILPNHRLPIERKAEA